MKFPSIKYNNYLIKLLPKYSFEWIAGCRKVSLLIVFLSFIGILGAYWIPTVPISILILGLIPIGFYEKSEPYQLLIFYEQSPQKFIFNKIKIQITIFSLLILPLVFVFLIFHISYWYIIVSEFIVIISIHIYTILTKYAFYESNNSSSTAQLYISIGTILTLVIMPVFLPAIWITSYYFYYKSIKKLHFYLHDFD